MPKMCTMFRSVSYGTCSRTGVTCVALDFGEGCSYTYPSLSIARYSFIQLSELEQCRVKKLAHGFNTAAQDSNPGSR